MIQTSLNFTTAFNLVLATPKFVLTDTTNYASEGISLTDVVGVFTITGPSGVIYSNTNFASPDIDANSSLVFNSLSIPLDTNGAPIFGDYTFEYTIRVAGEVQPGDYSLTGSFTFCYTKPVGAVEVTSNLDCAIVTSTDNTSYAVRGVNPSLSRVHKLYYPANLELSAASGSTAELTIAYPNVYTGTYTGSISTTATYTFTDGLVVVWLITAVDETEVNSETLCDIYCGLTRLTNEYLNAKETGDFTRANKINDKLSIIALLQNMYYEGKRCGEDVSIWLEKIIEVANITPGCGCSGDEPVQVMPFCGVSSGNTVSVVEGDASFGTEVSSATLGLTTTYTVRLSAAYKALILGALQSQDLSVSAFRAAGIPVGARGADTITIPTGGGTLNLVAGTSKNNLILKGSGTLTSGYTVSATGTPINGDYFIVQYEGAFNLDGNNITIFGKALSQTEASSSNLLVISVYSSTDSAWHTTILTRGDGSSASIPSSITVWEASLDFTLGTLKLFNSPSLLYKCIQVSGSGSNPPPTTPTNNTWWQYVGVNGSLFSASNSLVLDTTTGEVQINNINTASLGSNFIVLWDPADNKLKKIANTAYLTSALTQNYILIGDGSNIATPTLFNSALVRSLNLAYSTGETTYTLANAGAIVNLTAGQTSIKIIGSGNVTGAYQVNLPSSGVIPGDVLIIKYKATCTITTGSIGIGSIGVPGSLTPSGDIVFVCTYHATGWDQSMLVGFGNLAFLSGTNEWTLRYNASGKLVSTDAITSDGNSAKIKRLNVTDSLPNINVGLGSLAVGNVNNGNNWSYSFVSGESNSINGNGSFVSGRNNTGASVAADDITAGIACIGTNNCLTFGYENKGGGAYTGGVVFGGRGLGLNVSSLTIGSRSASGAIDYGQSQLSVQPLTNDSSSATPVVLMTDAPSTSRFIIPTGFTYSIRGVVVARQIAGSAGTVGDSANFPIEALVKNVAGTVTVIDSTSALQFSDAAAAGWTVTVVANSITQSIDITCTGQVNKTIRWVAAFNVAQTQV